jgi:tetratricopeptide (TPR) repeat protein
MSQAFDHIAKGEDLCRAGRLSDAERAFQRGIQIYERAKDQHGVAFGLGRLGNCYEQAGEADKALSAFRRAIQLGTDIPAIYHGLIGLLVDQGELDEAFDAADQWQRHGQRHIHRPAHAVFADLGAKLTREKRHEEAITLLCRAVKSIPVEDFPSEHWVAQGRLGHAYEQAGDLESAMKVYAAAIADDSADRHTYTRYLINLERQKRYEQALQVIRHGLKVQYDAAWEADLRKRQRRIERKAGKVPKGAAQKVIPVFSLRRGQKAVSLCQQIRLSPQLTHLTVARSSVYVTTGGKNPMLSAWQLADSTLVWQSELQEAASGVLSTEGSIIVYIRQGRVGDGETILRFFDTVGHEHTWQRLPDVPSEIIAIGGYVYAGCRDGKLYAFSAGGKPLWSFTVPGSAGEQESPYMRPSPYYVSAGANLVAFSSFEDVFALNSKGESLWRWSLPARKETSRTGNLTITMSMGPALVRALAATHDGSRVVAIGNDTIFELVGGKVVGRVKRKGQTLSNVALDKNGEVWVVGSDEGGLILRNQKSVGRFPAPSGALLTLNATADRVMAWSGKQLYVATLTGKLMADIEFVKNIAGVHCMDDGRLIVGAGHLVILDTVARSVTTAQKASKPQPEAAATVTTQPAVSQPCRQTEEGGIPIRWMEGDKLETGPGKAFYRGSDGQPITIEQLALEHYRRLGYTGIWTENQYWWTITALLFWDVLFARLPDVFSPQLGPFPSARQDMPRDLFTLDFHPRREYLIAKRIKELTQTRLFGLRKPNIETELHSSFRRHDGTPCRLIVWDRFTADDLAIATKALTDSQLFGIMQRLFENFSDHRSGLPDLFLDLSGEPLFVEVKSAKERVAEHQIRWLLYLRDQIGVAVEICRVSER